MCIMTKATNQDIDPEIHAKEATKKEQKKIKDKLGGLQDYLDSNICLRVKNPGKEMKGITYIYVLTPLASKGQHPPSGICRGEGCFYQLMKKEKGTS